MHTKVNERPGWARREDLVNREILIIRKDLHQRRCPILSCEPVLRLSTSRLSAQRQWRGYHDRLVKDALRFV